jgi:hypothetical protein
MRLEPTAQILYVDINRPLGHRPFKHLHNQVAPSKDPVWFRYERPEQVELSPRQHDFAASDQYSQAVGNECIAGCLGAIRLVFHVQESRRS